MKRARYYGRKPSEVRFQVVIRHFPDLAEGYDGPALSLDEQIDGVRREDPMLFGTRQEAEQRLAQLEAKPDPSLNAPGDILEVMEILI